MDENISRRVKWVNILNLEGFDSLQKMKLKRKGNMVRKIVLKKEPLRIDFYGKMITIQPYVYGYDFTHFERICGYGGYRDYCVPLDRIKKIKIDGRWKKVIRFEKTMLGLEIFV